MVFVHLAFHIHASCCSDRLLHRSPPHAQARMQPVGLVFCHKLLWQNNWRQNGLTSQMLFSQFFKIMVKKVAFVDVGGGSIAPIAPPWIRPCTRVYVTSNSNRRRSRIKTEDAGAKKSPLNETYFLSETWTSTTWLLIRSVRLTSPSCENCTYTVALFVLC